MDTNGGLAYHRLQRTGPTGWWRPLVGVLAVLVLFLLASGVIGALFLVVEAIVERIPFDEFGTVLDDPGPVALAGLLLSITVLIPLAMLFSWALHGVGPGLLTSVAGRVRWRYLLGCAGLAFVTLVVTLVVSAFLPGETADELTAEPHAVTGRLIALLLITLLVVPVQAAAEEYGFRGYLTQSFGGLLPDSAGRWSVVLAVVGPAVIFALFHGAQDPAVFLDRFAFGIVAGLLAIRTGGLEAGVAMHIVNNWFAFTLAITLGSLGEAFDPGDVSWWLLPGTLIQSLLYLVLASRLAKRMGIATRTPSAQPV